MGLFGFLLIAVAVIAAGGSLLVLKAQRFSDATCDRLVAIAMDAQKIDHVRTWVASRTGDAHFMEAVRQNRSFEHTNPVLRKYIDLDWSYLGFAPNLAWVEFNIKAADTRNVDAKGIGSVSLHEGRSSVTIRLNSDDWGLAWPPEAMNKVRRIGNDVFVYCQDSR